MRAFFVLTMMAAAAATADDQVLFLPGQPAVKFKQYAGYIPVGGPRALFYYLAEAAVDASSKPLVLWLNGGPGCSSVGVGAMTEIGPFKVNQDGSLRMNYNAWNKIANVLFVDSPAGVGFSVSPDLITGDTQTAEDSLRFIQRWLIKFPEYRTRDLYLAGEDYAGHFLPQLADVIINNNKMTDHHTINLKGIAIGNGLIDDEDTTRGSYEFFWGRGYLSDEIYLGVVQNCNFSSNVFFGLCGNYTDAADEALRDINAYDVNAAANCMSPSPSSPCSNENLYVHSYLNNPEVQKALHARTGVWNNCNADIRNNWDDYESTILPKIKKLMANGLRILMYSGDADGVVPFTSTKYSLKKLAAPVTTPWYPWYTRGEVSGYATEYGNLTFVTIRGAGHFVPSDHPERAITFFSSFLEGKLPPRKS